MEFESAELKTNFGTPKPKKEIPFSENVSEQLQNLGIAPEMIRGLVLDVGAEDAEFAKAFSGQNNAEIISIDDSVEDENIGNANKVDARNLPYGDNTYDMVISHASVPNVFMSEYSSDFPELSRKSVEDSVSSALREIIRVLKPGEKAYLAPVLLTENYEAQKIFKEIVLKFLEDLEQEGVDVKLQFLRTEINPDNKEKKEMYRLVLTKPTVNTKK